MPDINRLSPVDSPSLSDLIPIWSQQNGRACSVTLANLATILQSVIIGTNSTSVIDINSAPFDGSTIMTADTPGQVPQKSVVMIGTVAGLITFTFAGDGSTITVPFGIGYNSVPFAVTNYHIVSGAVSAVLNMKQTNGILS